MSKLPVFPRLPSPRKLEPATLQYLQDLHRNMTDYLRQVSVQVNGISEGLIEQRYNARSAAPTGIVMRIGDIVPNLNPKESGTATAKYIVTGWMALTNGTASAGSVFQLRALTGN